MSRRSSRSKPNATGRNTSSHQRFSMLPHKVQYSRAYADLSPNAKALLIELIGRYNGKNNGDLALSETDAARRIGIKSRKTAGKAFGELLDVGLIAMTSDAYFHIKTVYL